ncbi:MAG: hypothetical protein A2086_08865 [Spirochaetes bacterium GWD1_27_9]|nr:MAG: hypothetical protein A2Z98_16385 [Spirochaetes bacterium GWB1_27_13]OHD27928.1 MAG: hypothetical protein A2Y34_14740 [Spirochaetes bacterium GWC1_27_15]OHD30741.1 MAG: hypothetical protein A2086_08865 [Spirochaetes bacterium GWD1_27_9]
MVEKEKKEKIIEVENKIKNFLQNEEFYLVETQIQERTEYLVTLFIYNKKDTSVESLGKINKKIYPLLEDIPFLARGFSLEVSSPGIFRKIKFFDEFNIFEGREIKITKEDGTTFSGILEGLKDKLVYIIDKNKNTHSFNLNEIKSASLNG